MITDRTRQDAKRVLAFLRGYEELCNRHGLHFFDESYGDGPAEMVVRALAPNRPCFLHRTAMCFDLGEPATVRTDTGCDKFHRFVQTPINQPATLGVSVIHETFNPPLSRASEPLE